MGHRLVLHSSNAIGRRKQTRRSKADSISLIWHRFDNSHAKLTASLHKNRGRPNTRSPLQNGRTVFRSPKILHQEIRKTRDLWRIRNSNWLPNARNLLGKIIIRPPVAVQEILLNHILSSEISRDRESREALVDPDEYS